MIPIPEFRRRKTSQPSPYLPRARAPAVGIPAKPLPPSPPPPLTLRLWPEESRNACSQPSSGRLPQSRPRAPEKIRFDVWRITPVYSSGLQNLVVTMAGGYEEAAEDIRALVTSTLDEATQQDRAFVAGASQALANWTEKYQLAMSQGENQSLHDQLARWDQVRQAGVTLSQKITSLTTDYEPGTTSSEIFRALLPDCFRRVRARTEATFHELHATLPTLLCQFVTPDQAGQILSAIFTCMCNYNTEICGMAMAQAVVPVYTIPNTYRVQQSLWEGICQIIPSIARTSGSGLCPFEPAAPHNTPVEQVTTAPAAGSTGVSSSTRKNTAKEVCQTGVPLGILPAGSVWVAKEAFQQHIPTINLADGDHAGAGPPKTSTPIKAAPEVDRSHSGKKLDISKIKGRPPPL